MKIVFKVVCLLLAMGIFGLSLAENTELIYTKAAFKRAIKKGFVVAYFYTLDKTDQDPVVLPNGKTEYTSRWHEVSRAESMIGRMCAESDYRDIISCLRINLTRGDLETLRDTYKLTGDSVLLFMEGVQIGKNILVSRDFTLSVLKKTDTWLKFDDFVQQELADRKEAERKKDARDRERRRAYNYYYGPRPYVGFGWGGGYYGPYWGSGWGSPYVGFGFSL